MQDLIEVPSLRDRIVETLIVQITTGTLQPGERLVEHQLMKQFGTSQTPVREALIALENDGYVRRVPRKGTVVCSYTFQEVADRYEMRYLLEEYAAKKAMQIGREALIASLQATVTKMQMICDHATLTEKDFSDYQQLNTAFHQAFFLGANNPILSETYLRIYQPLTALRRMTLTIDDNLRQSFTEHCQILKYVMQADITGVLALLEQHHARSLASLQKILQDAAYTSLSAQSMSNDIDERKTIV